MTQRDPDQLARLLPEFVRARDAAVGSPLRALLAVIAEQADIVAGDLDQLYADWFVETCQDWVLAYLGDLVGYRVPPGPAGLGVARTPSAVLRAAALDPRRDVANTVRRPAPERHPGGTGRSGRRRRPAGPPAQWSTRRCWP